MAIKTDVQLTNDALTIKNETTVGANSATRIGTMLSDIVENKINVDAIDTDSALTENSDTKIPSQKAVKTLVSSKQNNLVSGTNIKTINSTSILGSGNIAINKSTLSLDNVDNTSDINKPISNATQSALDLKADKAFTQYIALLSQTSTGAPVATTVFNNTGKTFSFSRSAEGYYYCIVSSNFPNANKIVCQLIPDNYVRQYYVSVASANTISLITAAGDPLDGLLSNTRFIVTVYN